MSGFTSRVESPAKSFAKQTNFAFGSAVQENGNINQCMSFDNILVVDDEVIVRKYLEGYLNRKRYRVQTAASLEEADRRMENGQYDLVFCDLQLGDGFGTDFLQRYGANSEGPLIVMITAHGTIENAVQCMRLGAHDYITKPLSEDEIEIVLQKAEQYEHLVEVNRYYNTRQHPEDGLLGETPAIIRLRELIQRVARTDATVLIQGETGTGKEVISREIHRQSARASKPYIKVNCAAISETLIESEFFGHEKGAFTGAHQRRRGRFELADGGTLLLDEISEISLPLQAKLLRVLQEKEFERVGGSAAIHTDVRVIATTNRNLLDATERGEFRRDLYYRLNVFPLQSTPLRERREDIPLLAERFLVDLRRKHGIDAKGFSESALEVLCAYRWPGNVRELQNVVEHAVIMTSSGRFIEPSVLSGLSPSPDSSDSPSSTQADSTGASLEEIERNHILRTLTKMDGNRTKAADQLGISIRTLRNKLNTYREQSRSEFDPFF